MSIPEDDKQATPITSRRSFLAKAAGAALAADTSTTARPATTEPPHQTQPKPPPQLTPANAPSTSSSSCPTTCAPSSPATTAASRPTVQTSTPSPPKAFASIATTASFLSATRRVHRSSPAIRPTPPKSSATAPASATCTLTGPRSRSSSANTATRPFAAASSSTPASTITRPGPTSTATSNPCTQRNPASLSTSRTRASPCPTASCPCSPPTTSAPLTPTRSSSSKATAKVRDYMVADRAISYLDQCAKDYPEKPFFIGCGFSKPHSPPTAPQRFFDLYNADDIQLPPDFAAWPIVPEGFPKAAIRMRNADLFIGRGASQYESKQVIRAYLASISWADGTSAASSRILDEFGLAQRHRRRLRSRPRLSTRRKRKVSPRPALSSKTEPASHSSSTPRELARQRPLLHAHRPITRHLPHPGRALPDLKVPAGVEGVSLTPLLNNHAPHGPNPPSASGAKTHVHGTRSARTISLRRGSAKTPSTESCSSTSTPTPWS